MALDSLFLAKDIKLMAIKTKKKWMNRVIIFVLTPHLKQIH